MTNPERGRLCLFASNNLDFKSPATLETKVAATICFSLLETEHLFSFHSDFSKLILGTVKYYIMDFVQKRGTGVPQIHNYFFHQDFSVNGGWSTVLMPLQINLVKFLVS